MSDIAQVASTIGAHDVEPSATEILTPGDKIADLFHRSITTGVLQRLTEKVRWVQGYRYQTSFYVGDSGVLLFDPLDGVSSVIDDAIQQVTDKTRFWARRRKATSSASTEGGGSQMS